MFGRRLVEQRFSLAHAAKTVEDLYLWAIRDRVSTRRRLAEATQSVARLAGYKLHRKYRRWAGTASTDDGNDRSQIAAILSSGQAGQTAPGGDRSDIEEPALPLRMPTSTPILLCGTRRQSDR